MITRIVRMEFQPAHVGDFLEYFDLVKGSIRNFPGVRQLELHRDANQPNVLYTYSKWQNEADLEAYRQSEIFSQVWGRTKTWFAGKPQAYSLLQEMIVGPGA
jgi:autoinducer 2-degrading protein